MHLQPGVHPVQPADFPRLYEVWELSVRATHHFLSEADIEFFRPLVRQELPAMTQLYCVRDAEGLAAGFVGVEEANVETLFVHPDWRGKGAGARLLRYAIDELGGITVDVNEQNEQAVGFYRHMGFEVAARSEDDGLGKPFPILHMRLARADATALA